MNVGDDDDSWLCYVRKLIMLYYLLFIYYKWVICEDIYIYIL